MSDLIQQGINAYKSGDREKARKLLIAATKQFPNDERSWGWLYNVCVSDRERIQCLQQILRINPTNEKAKQLLNELTPSELPLEPQPPPLQSMQAPASINLPQPVSAPLSPNGLEGKEKQMPKEIIVTTGDLQKPYEVIGPVYFQVSNKGLFSSQLSKLKKQYQDEIAQIQKRGQIGAPQADWGFIIGEWSVGQSDFELAFYIAVQELKKRAAMLGADAIVGMRQDIDLDTNAFAYFYLQMYGTAVKFTD